MSSKNDTNTSDSSPPPPESLSPPPPSPTDSSPPPPPSKSSRPPPSSSNSSPPPPSSDSSPPPPPPSSDSSPPPPPSKNDDDSSKSSPPPPSKDSDSDSPPPPSKGNSKSSPPPPPPPHGSFNRHSPPPPPPSLSSLSDDRSSNSNNDNVGDLTNKFIIAGGAAGGGVMLILLIIVCIACFRKQKKRKAHDNMYYYRDNSTGNKSSDYYNSGQKWNNNKDHAIQIPPEPTPPAHVSSEQWPAMPPPRPPAMSSSDLSSAGFSGGVPKPPPPPLPSSSLSLGYNQSRFTPEDLAAATGGYAKTNLLGQGGFGYVYKGVLPNGKEVAVKSLKAGSGQGEREFQAEVEIISRVHHRHLVSLVGYCISGDQRMLVYEFIPNSSLEHHLHGKGQPAIDFPSRLKIALGSAKGFAYLHEDCHPRIIHRDIKAANILLDYNYEAKVADFGLAKLSNDNYTHVSTRIMGTFGYLAPEYASSGKLSEKSDVYSYGVVLLELITGKLPVDIHSDEDSLVEWARPILEEAVEGGEYEELVDPRLNGEYDPHEMLRMIACAAACIRHSARKRPRMIQIVRALEGDASLDDLNEGMKKSSSAVFSTGSESSEFEPYNPEMKKFRKQNNGMSSQEFTSGEFGATGELHIQPSPKRSIGNSQEFIRKLKL